MSYHTNTENLLLSMNYTSIQNVQTIHRNIVNFTNPSFIKEILNNDFKELEKRICPTYEEIALDLNSERLNLEKHYEKLTTAVTKQGEDWHREINICILDLKKLLDSNDVSLTSAYKSRNAESRSLPPKINATLPSFSPHQINTQQFNQMFGSLASLFITTEEHRYTMKTSEDVSCPPVKPLLDEPEFITTIDTGKHISENRNLIICVADRGAGQVVVVNQAGKLRLRYTGHPFITKGSFYPRGITTDSQSQILKADSNNDYIHILDKEGQFLCYIENCYLQHPWGLRVDTKDNLFVAEFHIGKVKKIKNMY
ncbi:uncharacterized protein LOC134262495 [Saccostrea cucullata]|uniref:uncharacterized protein LOC134262495 n=1 Tax=Saccostrea cuccullata TaxID=36930 RepID=UPI002ED3D709